MEAPTSCRSATSSGNLTMKAIFTQCQEKKQSHNRLLEYIKKLYQSTPFVEFCDEFENYLLLALQVQEPNIHANNVLDFVAKFATGLCVTPDNKENDMNCSANSTVADLDDSTPTNENPLLIRLMKYLVQLYDVVNVSFRLHVVRLLKLLLTDMNTDSSVDDELFENLSESLLVCLKDKVAAIRVEAVFALLRLQDPANKECPVTKQYLQHLKLDPNPQVREAVLQVIGATTITLESVIDRTRDEKEKVRKRAYEYLADKVHIKALTISRRVRLLKEGLQDRSELVKTTVVDTLVPTWLNMCGGSVVTFLRFLDVGIQETEESLNVTKLALNAILDNITMEKAVNDFIKTLTEEKIIPPDELSCENSFYWLYLIKHLKKLDAEDGETFLEQMQPELIHYCQYIKSYITTVSPTWDLNKKLDHQFICEQLLEIASNYDLADMAGSQRLNAVVNDILVSNTSSASLVKPLIACIIKTKLDPEERLVMVAEMISNIKEPILTMEFEVSEEERKNARIKIAKIRVELNELQENLKMYVENEEFAKAQETKEEIQNLEAEKATMEKGLMPSTREVRTEKNDTDTLLKCMTMVTELMLQAPFKKMFPTLHTLMDNLLINGLHNPDPAVRKQGVLAVGLCSIINVSIANTYFVIFLQILQMDQPSIQLMSLKVIFDLLHMHGLEMFQPPEVVDESNETVDLMAAESSPHGEGRTKTVTNVVTILKSHLDSKIDDIRAITAQGLGRLLLLGHIYSSELLSHMILLWFNPTNDSSSLLLHFLGVFIPTYAARNGKQCFEEAFIPTLRTVLDAPHTSPLSRVNPIHMAKVILQLMQPVAPGEELVNRNPESELDVQESKPHDRLAEKICYEILKDADNSLSNQKLSQILTTLYLSSSCLPVHKNIITLIAKLKKRVRDKITLKNVDHFSNILKAILDSELTINENNSQSSQNEIDSASSQTVAEADIVPETSLSSSDSAKPTPPKQMRRDENSESSDLTFTRRRKKQGTKKKGRPKRNELLQTTPPKTAETNMMLTRSQEKVVGNNVRVKLVRLPQRKSLRIALSLTTTDSDSDAAMLPKIGDKIQKPEKIIDERLSSESEDSVSIRKEPLITRNQETLGGGNAINKKMGRPAKSTVNYSERPTRATVNSSERPVRGTNKSIERPTRGTNKSIERPVRESNKSIERPVRGSNKSIERPVRGSKKSIERPVRGSNKSIDRPVRGSNKSIERPVRGSNKSIERPVRGSNKSIERPVRGSNKSIEQPVRGSNKSIERPVIGSNKSIERPTRSTNKSIEQPVRGSKKSIEQPAIGTNKSVERPVRGSNKSLELSKKGSHKILDRPMRKSNKSPERASRGSVKSPEQRTRVSTSKVSQVGLTRANRRSTKKHIQLERASSRDSEEESDSRLVSINKRKESQIISSPERETRSNKKKERQSKLSQKNKEQSISDEEKSNLSTNSSYIDTPQNQKPISATVNKSVASLRSKNHQRISRVSSPSKSTESFTPISNQRNEVHADAGHSSTRSTRSNSRKTLSESTPKPTASIKKKPDRQKTRKHGLSSTLSPNASVIEAVSDDSVFSSPSPKRAILNSPVRLSERTKRKPLRYVEASDDDSFTSLRSPKTSPSMRHSQDRGSLSESKSNPDVNKKSSRIAKSSKTSRPGKNYSDTESDSRLRRSFSPNKRIEISNISKSTRQSQRMSKSQTRQKDARSGDQTTSSSNTPSSPRKTRLQWKNASDISSDSRLQLSSSDESDNE